MKISKDYSETVWEDYFYLDKTSPSGLRWKVDRMYGRGYKVPVVRAGDIAGYIDYTIGNIPTGWRVSLNNTQFMVHRIIYTLLHGCFESNLIIDHLDGDPTNNSYGNLELKSQAANMQNKKMYKNNKTGYTGVVFNSKKDRQGPPRDYWVAHWHDASGKLVNKSFSIKKYGDREAMSLAISYRDIQITSLNNDGANYTNRHLGILTN